MIYPRDSPQFLFLWTFAVRAPFLWTFAVMVPGNCRIMLIFSLHRGRRCLGGFLEQQSPLCGTVGELPSRISFPGISYDPARRTSSPAVYPRSYARGLACMGKRRAGSRQEAEAVIREVSKDVMAKEIVAWVLREMPHEKPRPTPMASARRRA
jgi:hypothetical protein